MTSRSAAGGLESRSPWRPGERTATAAVQVVREPSRKHLLLPPAPEAASTSESSHDLESAEFRRRVHAMCSRESRCMRHTPIQRDVPCIPWLTAAPSTLVPPSVCDVPLAFLNPHSLSGTSVERPRWSDQNLVDRKASQRRKCSALWSRSFPLCRGLVTFQSCITAGVLSHFRAALPSSPCPASSKMTR